MSTDERDDLVGDVADALTLDQKVQWERCARLAAGEDREKIENLRVIERVLASRPVAGPAPETVQPTRRYGSALVGRAVHALIAIATLEVAATLLLLPWAWGDYLREHGEVAVYMTTKFAGHAARRRPVAVGRSRGLADLAAGDLLPPQGHPSAAAHDPGLFSGAAAAAGVRGLYPAPARRQPALRCPLRSRVPVRAGLPVGVRPRVPAGPSPDLAR